MNTNPGNNHTTFSGAVWGILTGLFFFAPIGLGIMAGLSHVFPYMGEALLTLLFIAGIFVFPLIAGVGMSKLISDYENGNLLPEAQARVLKIKRFFWGTAAGFFGIMFLGQQGGLGDVDEITGFLIVLGTPLFIGMLISFILPVSNRVIKSLVNSSSVKNEARRKERTTGRWILDKIIAPVISGIILGLITYMITGSFSSGSSVSIISIPISWVINKG
jgi:hypothetical protein